MWLRLRRREIAAWQLFSLLPTGQRFFLGRIHRGTCCSLGPPFPAARTGCSTSPVWTKRSGQNCRATLWPRTAPSLLRTPYPKPADFTDSSCCPEARSAWTDSIPRAVAPGNFCGHSAKEKGNKRVGSWLAGRSNRVPTTEFFLCNAAVDFLFG